MTDKATILPILKKIPIFSQLNEADHGDIIQAITMMYYPARYVIFAQGDEADALYIIKSGSARVYTHTADGSEKEVANVSQFDFFGEMALFKDSVRTATVETLEETEVLKLGRAEFFELIAKNAHIGEILTEKYVCREKENKSRSPV